MSAEFVWLILGLVPPTSFQAVIVAFAHETMLMSTDVELSAAVSQFLAMLAFSRECLAKKAVHRRIHIPEQSV